MSTKREVKVTRTEVYGLSGAKTYLDWCWNARHARNLCTGYITAKTVMRRRYYGKGRWSRKPFITTNPIVALKVEFPDGRTYRWAKGKGWER